MRRGNHVILILYSLFLFNIIKSSWLLRWVWHKFICPIISPWWASINSISKKDGSHYTGIVYHKLNKVTIKNKYSILRIDDLLDQPKGAMAFSQFYLIFGYHCIRVEEDIILIKSIKNQYGFLSSQICHLIYKMSHPLHQLDDTVIPAFPLPGCDYSYWWQSGIFSECWWAQISPEQLVEILSEQQLYVMFNKYHFWKKEVHFLGHNLSENGSMVDLSE